MAAPWEAYQAAPAESAGPWQAYAKPAPTAAAPPDPTEGVPKWQLLMAGLGKFMHDTNQSYQGAMAELQAMGVHLPGIEGTSYSKEDAAKVAADIRKQTDDEKRRDAPLLATPEGQAGQLWGQIGSAGLIPAARGVGLLGRLAGAGLTGGAIGAVQPVGENDSRGMNMAVGGGLGMAGQGAAETLGAIVRPATSSDPARQAAMEFADRIGAPTTTGERSGNTFVQRMERMLASAPGSQGYYARQAAGKKEAVDNFVGGLTGGDPGQVIQDFGAGKSMTLDPAFIDKMRGVRDSFAGIADRDAPNGALKAIDQYVGTQVPNPYLANLGPAAKAQAIQQGVPEFVGGGAAKYAAGDTLPMVGPQGDFNNYQNLRSLYASRAFGAGDKADKSAYQQIQQALDEAAMRSLAAAGEDPAKLAQMRAAYSADATLRGAKTVAEDGTATYNPQKIASIIAGKEARQPSYLDNMPNGLGDDLRALANYGRVVKPVSSSGTAENQMAAKVVGLGVLEDFLTGKHGAVIKTLAGLTGAPFAVNTALQATRNGVPGLRSLPPELAQALTQAAATAPPILTLQQLGQQ